MDPKFENPLDNDAPPKPFPACFVHTPYTDEWNRCHCLGGEEGNTVIFLVSHWLAFSLTRLFTMKRWQRLKRSGATWAMQGLYFRRRVCSSGITRGCQMVNPSWRSGPSEQRNAGLEAMPTGISTPRLFAGFFNNLELKETYSFLSLFRTAGFVTSFVQWLWSLVPLFPVQVPACA